MRWEPGDVSGDIEDRRDEGGGGGGMGFGGGGMRLGLGGVLFLGILSLIFHQNFFALLGTGGGSAPVASRPMRDPARNAQEDRLVRFVSFVLDDAQATWTKILPESGVPYRHAKLVLFRGGVDSACGAAESAMGPFYCPGDEKVYIDLGFYDELRRRFGAPGDFAQAYVLAHEIGHHVQKLLGIESKVRRLQQRNPDEVNHLSVRLELQADCFAGIWGHSTNQRGILEAGDVDEALRAAAAVGDDRIQQQARGRVSPESFTHGTSAQRQKWFRQGFDSGEVSSCNTFGGSL